MQITLIVTDGPHRGRAFTFSEHSTFLVGRNPQAHFALPDRDPYFSRWHFLVEVNPPLCRLQDLGSRNGTMVNGVRVTAADLRNGDRIEAGHTAFAVHIGAADPAAPTDHGPPVTLDAPVPAPHIPTGPGVTATLPGPARSGSPPTVPGAPPTARPTTPLPPPTVPGYRLETEVGRGGMGVVYRAVELAGGATVAVKTVTPAGSPSRGAVERFLREVDILRGLTHAHIVGFRAAGETGGHLWFAMEFVPGTDAAAILAREGPLPAGRAVRWACQLLEALDHAHRAGFVHRDLKPGNLLVGPGDAIKLADFGLARAWQASPLSGLTVTGSAGGTPAYMPPEQVLDFRTARPPADQYGAAAALYHLLTGRFVYDDCATPADWFRKILSEPPVPLTVRRPDLPAGLASVVGRALAREPGDRYPDTRAFRAALLPFGK